MLKRIAAMYKGSALLLCKVNNSGPQPSIDPVGTAFGCYPGYALTCAHTFKLSDRLVVTHQDSGVFMPVTQTSADGYEVTVAQYDPVNDVALLKLPDGVDGPKALMLGADAVKLGASAAYLGYPLADRGLFTNHFGSAIVSNKVTAPSGTRQFQLDATIQQCCSGAALIDLETAAVIGIVAGRFAVSGSNQPAAWIGAHALGSESSIAFATAIEYGQALMRAERLNA